MLFYYSGHGAMIDNKTYLLSVGYDTKNNIVALNGLLNELNKLNGNTTNIFILDTCRNNPLDKNASSSNIFTKSSTIKRVAKIEEKISKKLNNTIILRPVNSIFAYATGIDDLSREEIGKEKNGYFTKYLLKHIHKEGLSISDLFQQVRNSVNNDSDTSQRPEISNSLTGEFYFDGKLDIESIFEN